MDLLIRIKRKSFSDFNLVNHPLDLMLVPGPKDKTTVLEVNYITCK